MTHVEDSSWTRDLDVVTDANRTVAARIGEWPRSGTLHEYNAAVDAARHELLRLCGVTDWWHQCRRRHPGQPVDADDPAFARIFAELDAAKLAYDSRVERLVALSLLPSAGSA